MLFNSTAFAVFLPLVFVAYWALAQKTRAQNLLVLAASYLFYGWWDWRFLGLIVVSSVVDYLVGGALPQAEGKVRRRLLLGLSLGTNLGLLGFFKYYNFFVESLVIALGTLGLHASPTTLQLVLPVGISFYTFQTLSYTIDIYREKLQPVRDPLAFFAFVSFFPQLVAGPIERAAHLLPQFLEPRTFDADRARDGLRRILWGLFKKVVVADNLAVMVDGIFADPSSFGRVSLAGGVFLFAIQIYCDFSGYSAIAIGCARLLGFDLVRNFAYPYFARDVAEFWRRWHISLSTWFRDYVYIPLGGSRTTPLRRFRNIIVTFTVSGFWHGANWTFVIWGFLHGLFYAPLALTSRQSEHKGPLPERLLPHPRTIMAMTATFLATCLAWVFFRAPSVAVAGEYLTRLVMPAGSQQIITDWHLFLVGLVLVPEWLQRHREHALDVAHLPLGVRWPIYYVLIAMFVAWGRFVETPFIYFQF